MQRPYHSSHMADQRDTIETIHRILLIRSQKIFSLEDDLREYRSDTATALGQNLFSDLFAKLAQAVSTQNLNIPGTEDYAKDPTPQGDLSNSSGEDKPESAKGSRHPKYKGDTLE